MSAEGGAEIGSGSGEPEVQTPPFWYHTFPLGRMIVRSVGQAAAHFTASRDSCAMVAGGPETMYVRYWSLWKVESGVAHSNRSNCVVV